MRVMTNTDKIKSRSFAKANRKRSENQGLILEEASSLA